jgi:hypothetical protein
MQIAMACNLHKIPSSVDLKAFPPSLLPPPADAFELVERINAFWFIFVVDRVGSLSCGLPIAVTDEVRLHNFTNVDIDLL